MLRCAPCCRASLRDAIPKALRLPRRFAPRNDKVGGFNLKKERCFGLKTTAYDYKHSFFKQKRSKFMSLRGGRVRPTRQSLTERRGIPERNTENRNETESEIKRENSTGSIIRLVVPILGVISRFALPCLAAGCHTLNFKIATAALRPRNDKTGEFYGSMARFSERKV